MIKYKKRLQFGLFLLSEISALIILTRCSLSGVTLGTGGSTTGPNDPRPSGAAVAQGNFAAQNNQPVSGTAYIFQSGTSYILRLEGLSAPSENGLTAQVYASTSGTPAYSVVLSYYTGNQNFTFTPATPGGKFTNVYLYSSLRQTYYGTALLTSTTQ